jgi:TonB family protein
MGPFFESRDVDRAPQVTSRIEPNLPDDVDLTRQEILIVRVLVSQSGQPSLVSLLRRSKSGSALDAAVVDAVKRWSFSPAIRRGEAVSCFLNVGVPVGSKP